MLCTLHFTFTEKILILQVEIYKGIPFAAPPIGSLRFMPPVTVTPWREIRSATHFGPVCPQILPDTRNETAALSMMSQGRLEAIRDMKPKLANQTEDCLYLNVYSPKSKSGRTWPWPKLIWLIFSFTTLQSHETISYTASNQVLDHPENLSGHTVAMYCKTVRYYDGDFSKDFVGEKIIAIKCRTLESSKKKTKAR